MPKAQAPAAGPLRLPDNAVDVTARHLGTTVVLAGARPEQPSLKAKVTSALTGTKHGTARKKDPAA